jgi:hypothetical protein
MRFGEKWFWATYMRGENPISEFFWGILRGFWVPIVVSAVFCLFTDPQFKHHSLNQFDVGAYVAYYCYFWKSVWQAIAHFTKEYVLFAWYHWDEVVNFARRVLWLD